MAGSPLSPSPARYANVRPKLMEWAHGESRWGKRDMTVAWRREGDEVNGSKEWVCFFCPRDNYTQHRVRFFAVVWERMFPVLSTTRPLSRLPYLIWIPFWSEPILNSVPTKADFLPSADADCTVKQQTVAIGRSRSSCRMPYLLSNLLSNTAGLAVTESKPWLQPVTIKKKLKVKARSDNWVLARYRRSGKIAVQSVNNSRFC